MWLSDYFLGKYVKEQQKKFENSPHEVREQEPISADTKSRIVHNEIEKMNMETLKKKEQQETTRLKELDKLKKTVWRMSYDERGYVQYLKELNTAEKTVITNQKSVTHLKSASISK